jgi:hypothetical protein
VSRKSRRHGAPEDNHRAPEDNHRAPEDNDRLSVLIQLWDAIGSADLLQAEIETSTTIALPRVSSSMDAAEADDFIAGPLIESALDRGTPEAAAFLRLLLSLGSPVVKRAAREALGHLTEDGVYPLGWVAQAGQAIPLQAWRRHDVFGDHEMVAVTFGYGGTEHVLLAQIERAMLPVVYNLAISADPDKALGLLRDDVQAFVRFDEISLAEARRRLADALKRGEDEPDVSDTLRAFWPLAMSRVRRLPTDAAGPVCTAGDRAAAVDDFLKSPEAEKLDQDSGRFWAQVLTGYTARIPGEPPTQIGPHMLPVVLLGHAPAYFTLTAAQRDALEPAVTAWVTWSAGQRGLDEAATRRLTDVLPDALEQFGEAYDDPESVASRALLDGAVTADTEPLVLADIRLRREFAAVGNGSRDLAAEFGDCTPPDGMTSEEFVAAVTRVLDELWTGAPAQTWGKAKRMLATDVDRHDILHTLASAPPRS